VLSDADESIEPAKSGALGQAGLNVSDIDVFEFYDAFTITVARQIEAFGLCGPGEAPDFVRSGNFAYDSSVPCNTSGTEHSWSYLQGFTHLTEAVRQLRGEGGPTQVRDPETALVTGIGKTDAGTSYATAVLTKGSPS
jgi:acetyl-CoA acetyltransferase